MMEFIKNLFLPDSALLAERGLLGDYVGGLWGTVLAVVGTILVWRTYTNSKKKDLRDSTLSIFGKMLESYEQIIGNAKYDNEHKREVFGSFMSAFDVAMKAIEKVDAKMTKTLTLEDRIDISFLFVFYGTSITADYELSRYDHDLIVAIRAKITGERANDVYFKGYQNVLSNYFRTIYNAYEFLHQSDLSDREKYQLGKVFRSKFTNYEQAVIALNIISRLGKEWRTSGLLMRYKIIKNLPNGFLSLPNGATVKTLIPYIDYEWEKGGFNIMRHYRFDSSFINFWIQIKLFPRNESR